MLVLARKPYPMIALQSEFWRPTPLIAHPLSTVNDRQDDSHAMLLLAALHAHSPATCEKGCRGELQ